MALATSPVWAFEHQQETDLAPEAIWRVLSDLDHWAEWDSSMEWVRLDGPLAVGSSVQMKPLGQEPITSVIVAVVPGQLYADETAFDGLQLRFSHELLPAGDARTRVVHRLEIRGDQAAQRGLAVGGLIVEDFPQAMAAMLARGA